MPLIRAINWDYVIDLGAAAIAVLGTLFFMGAII
jgi:hypothetical protein